MESRDTPLEWIASFVAIACSTFRALNLGYQSVTYALSIAAYLVFIAFAKKQSQVFLNLFYIVTALIGVWSWYAPPPPPLMK